MHVLLLGGTTEASRLAHALADAGISCVFSYAGRTKTPVAQPLPTRVGGFGGVDGLVEYLKTHCISHVVDATHPFAAGMSQNAYKACTALDLPLIRLERPEWQAQEGDQWTDFPDLETLVSALPDTPARVFLAIGKQQIHLFSSAPQHHYLLRLVDQPDAPLPLPHCSVVVDRGPFTQSGDLALLRQHKITHVVSKNAGGRGAAAKLSAARALGLPVLMVARPKLPTVQTAGDTETVLRFLGHPALRGV